MSSHQHMSAQPSRPIRLEDATCVAATGAPGEVRFEEISPARRAVAPGSVETAWFWQVDDAPTVPTDVGGPVVTSSFPLPGGAKFGLVSFLGGSEGKMSSDKGLSHLSPGMTANDSSTGMHTTRSVDFEIILSGRILVELPGGESRELGPGDSIVMGGVPHRWSNPFDEPCIYAAMILGAAGADTAPASDADLV